MPSASEGPSLFDDLPAPVDEAGAGGDTGSDVSLFDDDLPASSAEPDAGGRSSGQTPNATARRRGRSTRSASGDATANAGGQRVVRVLPDEPAIAKTFDYLVPEGLGDQVRVGTRVRIALGPRRVGGWVVAIDVEPPADRQLRPLAKLSGHGPPAELIDLAHWAAWRWSGRPATFLRTASPERIVTSLPRRPAPRRLARPPASSPERQADARTAEPEPPGSASVGSVRQSRPPGEDGAVPGSEAADDRAPGAARSVGRQSQDRDETPARDAFSGGVAVLRVPPGAQVHPVIQQAVGLGNALVVCPGAAQAEAVARRLRRDGVATASYPRDWGLGAAGATVVGTRAAAWAPVGDLAAVVVLDEHDEGHAQEQAPTWHARDVVVERARRAGVPCVLVSPCPTLEALRLGRLLVLSRRDERDGWPIVDVVDRRDDDPRTGLFSPALVDRLRSDRRVLCVLNRTGRARLLACRTCGELACCERCDAAVIQMGDDELSCPRCGATRPVVCAVCGSTRLKLLRQGVSRVREELEALVGEPVGEVTATSARSLNRDGGGATTEVQRRVVVGTEAVLHQIGAADVVAFLDLDQELLAPRYRAAEQALGLLARAARLLGGKGGGGRLVLQTRLPHHEVVEAALHGDPERVAAAEEERRELLRFPPVTALAEISGPAAAQYVAALTEISGSAPPPDPAGLARTSGSTPPPDGTASDEAGSSATASWTAAAGGGSSPTVEIMGPADGRWLVRADDHGTLCDALAATPRPPGRLRIAVDPPRV